jgi:hypothetical protein
MNAGSLGTNNNLDTVSHAFTFDTISLEQLRTVAGGNSPATWKYQGKNSQELSAKDQAKQEQAVGQGVIWGTTAGVGTALTGQEEFVPVTAGLGFAAGYVSSLWGSYGPGSS